MSELVGTRTPRRARWAVTVYFALTGAGLATWTARIPEIKRNLGLDDGQVTLALFSVAAGSVLAMQVAGRLADRFGSERVLGPAGILLAASLLVPGFAGSLPVLVVGLLVFGAGHGTVDVSMNAQALLVQRRYGRPIVSTFHAMFSVGGLLGAGTGALAAHLGIGVAAHFAVVAAVTGVLLVVARSALVESEHVRSGPRAGEGRGVPAVIVFLGVLAFFCSLGEGSMADWSPLYLSDVLDSGPAVAAVGYAVFSAAMATFRFLGDRLVSRFGPVALVRGCGLIAGVGLGAALLVHHVVAAIIGFGLFGVGLSCIIPQVFNAAGSRDPSRSARDLAQVSTLGYGGLLAGPVVIGLVTQSFGLTVGLAVPAALALLVAASAGAVRPRS